MDERVVRQLPELQDVALSPQTPGPVAVGVAVSVAVLVAVGVTPGGNVGVGVDVRVLVAVAVWVGVSPTICVVAWAVLFASLDSTTTLPGSTVAVLVTEVLTELDM